MTLNLRFHLKLIFRGFVATRMFDLDLKITISLFTTLCVNSTTFSLSVGMTSNFILRLLMPNYGGWWNQIFKISLRDCVFKAGVFSSFFQNFQALSQIGLPYLFFCVLKAPAPSEYGNEVLFSQKSWFTIKNVNNINLILSQN